MDKIVFVQPIFCPNQKMFDFNKNSLLSLKKYLKTNKTENIDYVFGGYGIEPFYSEIKELIKSFIPTPILFDFGKNYGKAVVVNTMLTEYFKINKADYIFTLDSDMLFNNNENDIFERLQKVISTVFMGGSNAELSKVKIGIVACNMTGDNAHWIKNFENRFSVGDEVISFPNNGVGIAGGCLFIKEKLWREVGGYRTIGVYAPDDAALMHDCRRVNHLAVVVETIKLHHPGTHDDKVYQSWKVQTAQKALNMSFKDSVEYTENFWSNYK
jgi:hypothetical protein